MKVLGDGFTIFHKFVMLQEFPVVECVSLTVGVVNSAKKSLAWTHPRIWWDKKG